MKKGKIIMITTLSLLMLLAVFTCAHANHLPDSDTTQWDQINLLKQIEAETDNAATYASAELPASLTTIEDEAFEGTSITTVELPNSVEVIGHQAFANIESLKKINIPDNTIIIGKDAFKGSNQVAITGTSKGYARTWAKENGIPFIPVASFYAFNTSIQITGLSTNRTEQQKLIIDGETKKNNTPKPTGRMAGELKADRYEKLTAYHIQGRSPPI